jgi:hypothetical protein
MKKIRLFVCFLCAFTFSNAQNCIDAVIIRLNEFADKETDTVFCKILSADETSYLIDNGLSITSISKNNVIDTLVCFREMNIYEVFKFKGIDNVTQDYFNNSLTAGDALRKAAFKTYLATGLGIVGGGSVILGLTVFNDAPLKPYLIIGGSLITATSLFFVVTAWNQIYKAGKLLDLNEKASLFLNATPEGNLGLTIRF